MAESTTWGLVVAAAGGLIGYAIKYWNDLQIERSKAEIKFLSDQIQFLYGPLHALCAANESAWETFRSKYRPQGAFFGRHKLSESELEAWRQWTVEVFMPTNRAIVELILKNTHLIEGSQFPECFSAIISHVRPYEIVLSKWAKGDFSEHTAFSNYPNELNTYVGATFDELKKRQTKLLQRFRL